MGDLAPIGMELDRGDGEDEQAEAEVPEESLDPLEGQNPAADDECHDRERDQDAIREAGEELEADGDASDLRRARHQVHDLGCDEGRKSRAEAGPLPDEVEDGALGHRRDATAHLRIHDDPEDPHDDDPEELETEGRSSLRVEDQIADVDEAADGREDAEGDGEEVLQAHVSPSPTL